METKKNDIGLIGYIFLWIISMQSAHGTYILLKKLIFLEKMS